LTKEGYKYLQLITYNDTLNWNIKHLLSNKNHNYLFETSIIGNIMARRKEAITVQDEQSYKRITIQTKGGGVHVRDCLAGKHIKTKEQYLIHSGQLAISKIDARNGAVGIVPKEAECAIITGNFWVYDVDINKANIEYLVLLLSSSCFVKVWQECSNGSGNRLYLQEKLFLNYDIPLPPIVIQNMLINKYNDVIVEAGKYEDEADLLEKSIIEKLNSMLGIIDMEAIRIKGLSTIKYSQVHKWGIDFLTTQRSIYNKRFMVKPLSSICDVGSGGTPNRSNPAYYNGNIPWVKTGEILNEVIMGTEEQITETAINNSSAKVYPKGSLLIAMYGQGLTRGRTAKLGIDAATNQACSVLYNIDTNKVLVDYLWVYLHGEYQRIRALAYGNNQPNLNGQIIKDYPVVLPPMYSNDPNAITQESIIKEVFAIKSKIKSLRQKAANLREKAKKQFEEAVFGEN